MVESLGLGTKSSGPEANTKTSSWFRLPIPKPGFGRKGITGSSTTIVQYPMNLPKGPKDP